MSIVLFTHRKTPLPLFLSRQTAIRSLLLWRHKTPVAIVLIKCHKNSLPLLLSRQTPITSLLLWCHKTPMAIVLFSRHKIPISPVFNLTLKIHKKVSLIILCTESYDLREQRVYNDITKVCVHVWRRKSGRTNACPCQERTKGVLTISTEDVLLVAPFSPVSNSDTSIWKHFLSKTYIYICFIIRSVRSITFNFLST